MNKAVETIATMINLCTPQEKLYILETMIVDEIPEVFEKTLIVREKEYKEQRLKDMIEYGWYWCNDGKKNYKRVKEIEELPKGWSYGRVKGNKSEGNQKKMP